MKWAALESAKILTGAAWGAATRDIEGDQINEYRHLLCRMEVSQFNQNETTLKQMLLSQVMGSLSTEDFTLEDLLTIPWASRRIELPRVASHLIAFTNDCGREFAQEFHQVDEIITYLTSIRQQFEETGEQLTVPTEFAVALSQTNNNPIAAALLAHCSYRAIARLADTRISPRLDFPISSSTESISMMSIAESTADFIDTYGPADPLGNTYHFWSQFTAGMVFALEKREKPIEAGFYDILFYYAPELTTLVRRGWGHKPQQFGNHKEADLQGHRLGRAAANLIMNKVRPSGKAFQADDFGLNMNQIMFLSRL